jgi:nitrite reductase/ring-hydroxylating ferredoxin subunit
MPEYRVGTATDIPEGGKLVVACGSVEIGIFRLGGALFAWHNSCAHRQGPICQGRLFRRVIEPVAADGTVRTLDYATDTLHIVCPWHGYEFDVRTGEHPGDSSMRLRKAQVREEAGDVFVSP